MEGAFHVPQSSDCMKRKLDAVVLGRIGENPKNQRAGGKIQPCSGVLVLEYRQDWLVRDESAYDSTGVYFTTGHYSIQEIP